MRVSGKSKSNSVAGAVAGILRSGDDVKLEAIGQPAVYIAVKAMLTAGNFIKNDGLKLITTVTSEERDVQGTMTTVIVFEVQAQKE